jgi:sugar phosphate isomerase/epimerase
MIRRVPPGSGTGERRCALLAFGYNTNGFAHHDLIDAIEVLAGLGYAGVGITLDVPHLHPLRATADEVARVAKSLDRCRLRCVVETGARYVLDPLRKHEPTLLSEDPEGRLARVRFLERAIDIAADLRAEAVALFAGRRPESTPVDVAWDRLGAGLSGLLEHAEKRGVTLAFEPEPGMLVVTLDDYDRLVARVGERLMLTLDLGHVACSEATSIAAAVARTAPRMKNAHVEDIRGRTHEHLPFGEGEIDFPPALAALEKAGYAGLVQVELSRHSHDAPRQAERSIAFLRAALAKGLAA